MGSLYEKPSWLRSCVNEARRRGVIEGRRNRSSALQKAFPPSGDREFEPVPLQRRVYWNFHCPHFVRRSAIPSPPPEVCVGRSAHHFYALRSRSRMSDKFVALTAAFVFCASTAVFAQSRPVDQQTNSNPSGSVMQPQGKTGPIVTERGGAPASSPQGETPPGMQAAPKGSGKKITNDQRQ
jgi:hypothetical protein